VPVFYLTAAAVLFIHERLFREIGGGRGLRDEGALLAALARPRATYARRPLYPTLPEKAAALLESLCRNHPFVDGNKRVAYVAAGLFLRRNGWAVKAPEDEAVEFMMGVAAGELRKEEIRIWFEEHTVPAR
jgi:death-on-curing protein